MKSSNWIWVGVVLVFVLMGCAWTAMFLFSRQAHVESVPLVAPAAVETPEAR
jgi:predicted alpha/beta hydrolase family esterase